MTLIFLTIAWIIGLLLGLSYGGEAWPFLAVAATILAFAGLASQRDGFYRQALVVALCALGCARGAMSQPAEHEGTLAQYNGSHVTLSGCVAAAPQPRDTYTQVTLETSSLERRDGALPVTGRLLLNVPPHPALEYGDILRLSGELEEPPSLEGFDYARYLAARGIHSLMRNADFQRIGVREGPWVLVSRWALRLKARLRQVIFGILPGPEAGLLSGILLGLDHTLPPDLDEAFRRAGLTHIIVISGFNIGMVAQLFLLSNAILNRTRAIVVALVGVLSYAAFVGLSPPVARAALMGAISLGGALSGRRGHSLTSLAAATLLMTAINPLQLWDVSFQLSLAATLGLVLLEPALAQGLLRRTEGASTTWRKRARLVRQVLLVTVAAQLATIPITWYHFGELSLVALLANTLVLFMQPFILVAGAVATAAGTINLALGRVAAWAIWPALRYTTWVPEMLAQIPWASVEVPALSASALRLYYVALFGAVLASAQSSRGEGRSRATQGREPPLAQNRRRSWALPEKAWRPLIMGLAVIAVLLWMAVLSLPDGRWHLYFLDVGQGDAILLRSPGGRTVLVDGGPDPVLLLGRLGRVLPFWQRSLDLIIATHGDADHLSGLLAALESYDVDCIIESAFITEDGALVDEWQRLAGLEGAEILKAERGMSIRFGESGEIIVVHPPGRALGCRDENACSTVVRINMGEMAALLPADVDAATEQELVALGLPIEAQILKAAHHGSSGSTSAALLEAVRPTVAIISVGADNRYGHPSPEVLERLQEEGIQVWRTDECGNVEVITDGAGLWIRSSRTCAPDPG